MDSAVSLQSQQVLAWMGFVLSLLAGFMLYLQPFCIKLHDHMLKYAFTHLLYTWEQNNQALGRNIPSGTSAVHQNADHLPAQKLDN